MKKTFKLGCLSAINIAISFFVYWYALLSVGPSLQTDGLFAAMAVPQFILAVISASLIHVLVPILSGETQSIIRTEAWSFVYWVLIIFSFLAAILVLTSWFWVGFLFPGFDEHTHRLVIELTVVNSLAMIFTAINTVFISGFHAQEKVITPEIFLLIGSILSVVAVIATVPIFGVIAVAWAFALRSFLQTVFLIKSFGMPQKLTLESKHVLTVWDRIKPKLMGTSYYKTGPVVDRYLLSSSASGELSLYFLAQQIYSAVGQIANKAIAEPLVPELSKLFKAGQFAKFKAKYIQRLCHVFMLTSLVLVAIILLIQIVFYVFSEYINMTEPEFYLFITILIWLAGSLFGLTLTQIVTSAYYATGNTHTVMKVAAVSYTVFIPVKIYVYSLYGVSGLAAVASSYMIANLLVLSALFKPQGTVHNV